MPWTGGGRRTAPCLSGWRRQTWRQALPPAGLKRKTLLSFWCNFLESKLISATHAHNRQPIHDKTNAEILQKKFYSRTGIQSYHHTTCISWPDLPSLQVLGLLCSFTLPLLEANTLGDLAEVPSTTIVVTNNITCASNRVSVAQINFSPELLGHPESHGNLS